MLKPPYRRDELERLFRVELAALEDLLSTAIGDFCKCRSLFRERGFVADEPYNALLQAAAGDEIGKGCRGQLAGSNPDEVSLTDFVELYPNRMLQFMTGWPTPRVRYWGCLSEAVYKGRRSDLDAALRERWIAFAAEANRYPDTPMPAVTRESIVEEVLRERLSNAGFATFPVSRASIKKWHPRPSWVDAVTGVLRNDRLDVVLLGETPRPRKYAVLPSFSCEPDELDTRFDKINVSVWAIPKREISEFHSAAFRIMHNLFYYYWDFYSLKGLLRVVDAHVTAARIILRKV